ncbi:MAG: phosphatidylglycerophosphatase A, partial [Gammaproteobacteria bacterium]|nr:phosphatidylglycerophosphatase A [Gammaproteobacteria bacterium]
MATRKLSVSEVFNSPVHMLATGFGAGLSPVAPGTAGTLLAVPAYILVSQLPLSVRITMAAVLFVLGVAICELTR